MTPERRAAQRIALPIDADQFGLSTLDAVMNEAARLGTAVVVRAYRHWPKPMSKGWAKAQDKHGVEAVEQAPGHNATDMAMTIDAVDLMHERGLDGFVIVSNDKDFAPLAARLRRGRLRCMLVTSKEDFDTEYQNLWDQFIQLPTSAKKSAVPKLPAPKQAKDPSGDTERVRTYRDAIAASDLDGDWARLSEVGKRVQKHLRPTSRTKNWLGGRAEFEVKKRKFKNDAQDTDCVRAVKKA